MQVVILCGGRGTRAYPFTEYLPKPMLPIDGSPIVMHVMRLFADQGHKDFVLSVGYRKEVLQDYFDGKSLDWNVQLVDTGDETDTGGRISGCRDVIEGRFFATYADGLSNVPLDELVRFHDGHDGLATITSVPLRSQYGTIEADEAGRVLSFREKPVLREHWINAGFIVMDPAIFDHWEGTNLEQHVLPKLADEGLAYSYRHDGFFKSMDSYKDQQEFEELARLDLPPWRTVAGTSTRSTKGQA